VRVAERILEATNLGHVKGYSPSTFSPFSGLMDDGWTPAIDRSSSPASNQEWEVYVINDDTRNAFVLPGMLNSLQLTFGLDWISLLGGKIFVFTGILPACKNADGLASVLGHGERASHLRVTE